MKFYGAIGYGVTADQGNGVWTEQITERVYRGDVTRNTKRSEQGQSINDNITLSNTVSIVADAYAYENFANIKYVTWMGTKWTVSSVEIQRPRLMLTLGGVYNG